jgi:putative ABC transport system permease protein
MFDALVVGEVRTNPARALVTLVAVALGVGMWLALSLADDAVQRALRGDVALLAAPVDLRITAPGRGVDMRTLAAIRALADVREARPVVEGNAWLASGHGAAGEPVRVAGVDFLQALPGVGGFGQRDPEAFEPRGGPFDRALAIADGGVVVSARVAERLGLHVGQIARLRGTAHEIAVPVVYILPPSATGVDSSVAFVDFSLAQRLFDERGYLSRIDCLVYVPIEAARARLAAVVPAGTRVAPPALETSALGRLLAARERDPAALAIIASLVALALVYNGIGSSVAVRRAEIGALRSLGASRGAIFRAFVSEGALFGAIGGALGVGLALACAQPLAGVLTHGAAHGAVEWWWDLSRAGIALGGGIAAGAFAAAFPAFDAMRVQPAQLTGARGFESRAPLLSGAVTRFAGPLGTLGPAAYLASREIGGSPRRAFVALGAFVLAVGATVACTISDASLRASLATWTDNAFRGDLVVRPAGFDETSGSGAFASGVASRIATVPGVAAVTARRSFPIVLDGATATLSSTANSGLGADEANVTAPLAARLHLTAGSRFALPSPSGDVELRVREVVGADTDPVGSVLVDRALVAARYGDSRSDEIDVTLAPGAAASAIRGRILRELSSLRLDVVTTRELRAQLSDALAASFALSDSLEAITLGLSVGGLVITLAGVVLERRREFAMLRYIGASRSLVIATVRLEALLLCAFGCVAGTLAGVIVAYGLTSGAVAIPVLRIALALGATSLAVGLAAAYPARLAAAASASSARTAS